ncbi:alpha/beta hydrolase fold domain-containing protein [Mariniflexile ostreae]|uniref:Alpha/beta hydrolase fold domain-containing protein n=1 Tax=Mariniflexile ostreae TaxID=1520892 RepID=A0ABV5F9J1_9FLAO
MKNVLAFITVLAFFTVNSQTKVLYLENNTGIIEDNLGSVTLWENQVSGYGNATQSNIALGGDKLLETYPGKVNVGFSKDGSFLELEGSNTSISDNTYSVFYVGKSENVQTGKPASLLGNYDMSEGFSKCYGIRFIRLQDGKIGFDYARPNYTRVNIGTNEIPANNYFFFGFSIDASGNYKYFDSTSPIITSGTITNTMRVNTNENLKFNVFEEVAGAQTYNHTEVVELTMYDGTLDETAFQNEYNRLATEYAELVISEFSITKIAPVDDDFREGIPVNSPIVITFDKDIDETSDYPKVFINKSETDASGNWVLSPSNVLTFTPTENWPFRSLVTLKIQEGLKSTTNAIIGLANRDTYNFIVDAEETFEFETYQLAEPIAVIDYVSRTGENIVGHKLPIKITTPVIDENTTEKFPVHIFVHGGGWQGGSAETSSADYSLHKDYLAKSLGIVTLSISYRCVGSGGTYSYAEEDVDRAYQWAIDNAETYNLDMTKVFFSGGSAGTPLAAMASQRLPNVLGYIGFNGIYDFVNDGGDYGAGNWYKQDVPSESANSAIFHLSDNPPATILMHGDADTTISHNQSIRFADAINAAGGEAEVIIYPGEVHSFFSRGKTSHEDALYEMSNFMSNLLSETLSISGLSGETENKIMAYPNPVKNGDKLKIHLNSNFTSEKVQVQIINNLGQIVLNNAMDVDSNTIILNIKGFEKGLYFLKIETNPMSQTLKFIVQ